VGNDVVIQGSWSNPPSASNEGIQPYFVTKLKLHYPEALKMAEVTIDDVAKHPWLSEWMNERIEAPYLTLQKIFCVLN
jgi:hypothetical protein